VLNSNGNTSVIQQVDEKLSNNIDWYTFDNDASNRDGIGISVLNISFGNAYQYFRLVNQSGIWGYEYSPNDHEKTITGSCVGGRL
jgi:hypothetical protein